MNLKIFFNHGEQIVYFFVNLVNINQLERWKLGKRHPWGPKWLLGTSYTNDMTIFMSALYVFYAKHLPVCKSLVMISFLTVFFKFFFMRGQTINRLNILLPLKFGPL